MGSDRTGLTERITHAEDWLDRARRQIQEGDLDRGTLTLILAEAEVHRAREVSMTAPASTVAAPGRPRLLRVGAAAAALAVALALIVVSVAAFQFKAPVEARDVAPVLIVRLPARTGEMLRMVVAPEPVERTVEKRVVLRVPVPAAATARDDRSARPVLSAPSSAPPRAAVLQVATSAAAPAAPAPAAAITAAPAVAPAPALLNEADVIDLVLAAERSLRRSAKQ